MTTIPFPQKSRTAAVHKPCPRIDEEMAAVAHRVEALAYDLAGAVPTDLVARLMTMAAELERFAAELHIDRARAQV